MAPAASGQRYNPLTNDPGRFATSTVFRTGGINYVGRYTGVFTPWLTLSGAYGVNEDRDTTESANPLVASVVDQRGGTSRVDRQSHPRTARRISIVANSIVATSTCSSTSSVRTMSAAAMTART